MFFSTAPWQTVMGFVDMAWAPSSASVDSKGELLGKNRRMLEPLDTFRLFTIWLINTPKNISFLQVPMLGLAKRVQKVAASSGWYSHGIPVVSFFGKARIIKGILATPPPPQSYPPKK